MSPYVAGFARQEFNDIFLTTKRKMEFTTWLEYGAPDGKYAGSISGGGRIFKAFIFSIFYSF